MLYFRTLTHPISVIFTWWTLSKFCCPAFAVRWLVETRGRLVPRAGCETGRSSRTIHGMTGAARERMMSLPPGMGRIFLPFMRSSWTAMNKTAMAMLFRGESDSARSCHLLISATGGPGCLRLEVPRPLPNHFCDWWVAGRYSMSAHRPTLDAPGQMHYLQLIRDLQARLPRAAPVRWELPRRNSCMRQK